MNKIYLKANRGITLTDIVIAILIMSLFIGVLGSLYIEIATQNAEIKLNSLAAYNAIKIAEYIDKIPYEEVQNSLNNIIKQECNVPENILVNIEIQNYNEQDSSKQDIIKIAKIQLEYQVFDKTLNYKIEKLKIKEM